MKSWTRRRRNTPWWRSSWGTPSEPRTMQKRETRCCRKRWSSSSPPSETWPQIRDGPTEPTPSGSSEPFHSRLCWGRSTINITLCGPCSDRTWLNQPSWHLLSRCHLSVQCKVSTRLSEAHWAKFSELIVDQLWDCCWIELVEFTKKDDGMMQLGC